ncbi:hypothetical protein [Paraherbaspirillum soli]|uniref:Uncharacterized protein n=1 Tax=Paraherbaspirillum soli TaxID=631222 RepID=A0ABW0MAB5_9BURK
MVTIKKRSLIFITLLVLASCFIYFRWHEGAPYDDKEYSPNKEFYFQRFKVFSLGEWIPGIRMPGQGGDALYSMNGYVRVYSSDDKFIGEIYARAMPIAEIFWLDNKLIVNTGAGAMDGGIIKLPKDAETLKNISALSEPRYGKRSSSSALLN